jgi:hypothetical protein
MGYRPIAAVVAFILVLAGLCFRANVLLNVPGEQDFTHWVMLDFRDGTYYPVVSFLSGGNPYDADTHLASYPAVHPFSLYSPLYLVLHLPFGVLSLRASQMLFFAVNVGLTLILAILVVRMCGRLPTITSTFGIAALILASRPGHWNLLLGQPTLGLVIAVYVALYCAASRTTISGVATALATAKFTFGVPLALLMLAQRFIQPVVIGVGVALVVTLIPVAFLSQSAGGLIPFFNSLQETYMSFGHSPSDSPAVCPTRIDAVAFVSRIVGQPLGGVFEAGVFLFVLGVAGASMVRLRRVAQGRACDLYAIAVCSLAVLLCTYHQSYCAILLVLPISALLYDAWAPVELAPPKYIRLVLVSLLLMTMVNYLATFTVSDQFDPGSITWRLIVSTNGGPLLAAFAVYVWIALRPPRAASRSEYPPSSA